MAEELARALANGLIIKAPRRAIVRESSSRVTRYKVYLPTQYNELWEQLRRMGKDIDVLIIIRL